MLHDSDQLLGVRLILLLSLTFIAALSDLRSERIPNALVFVFLIFGFLAWIPEYGIEGVWTSLVTALLILLGLFPLFVLRALAGGDIKLFAGIAGIAGVDLFVPIFVMSLFCGGAVGVVVWLQSRLRMQRPWTRWLRQEVGSAQLLTLGVREESKNTFPFAPAIFLGTGLGILGYSPWPDVWLPL